VVFLLNLQNKTHMDMIWYHKDKCPPVIGALEVVTTPTTPPHGNQLWFSRSDAEAAVRAHLLQLYEVIPATVVEHVAQSYCEQTSNGKQVVDLDVYAEVAVPLHTLRAAVKNATGGAIK
jgi:hypothetical protein